MLRLKEVEKPRPAGNEVLVKVHAVSVNDWDWAMMDGTSLFNRLTSGFSKPKFPILGSDVAGVVESTGKNVTKFVRGDEVFGDLSGRWGGFAEYVCAGENQLAIKPAGMSFAEAAAIPQAAMLAVQALIDKGKLREGQQLLINGAGGGVGTFGLQIAQMYKANTTVVDSAAKFDMLANLGATSFIDYTKQDFTKLGKRYDLIVDTKTNRPASHYMRALNKNGTYVTVGGNLSSLFGMLLSIPWASAFSDKTLSIVALKPNKDLELMKKLFEEGKVSPVIDGHFELEDVPEAFRLFAHAAHKGKIVISIGGTTRQPATEMKK